MYTKVARLQNIAQITDPRLLQTQVTGQATQCPGMSSRGPVKRQRTRGDKSRHIPQASAVWSLRHRIHVFTPTIHISCWQINSCVDV